MKIKPASTGALNGCEEESEAPSRSRGGATLPAVSVPQQQSHVVDDGRLSQFDLDAGPAVLLDGVPGEAVIQVVVLSVPVQQRRLQLAFGHLSAVLHGGDVLLWY